ncbi:response regulator [Paraglaciecola sp. 2405UD69-4]|uniref:response regulator n=1 Tax=Paraglaciecola sp. 2405UD69-4 TaxID=3391836 RepID=UPI0039C9097E
MIEIPDQKPWNELKVLVIDGQPLVHTVIQNALVDAGINNIHSAFNAYAALRLCGTIKFDMVLIAFDVKSDKDGFNLLEEMKFKGYISKTTCVIFLSADTSESLVNCVVEMEPTDFWVKPLDKSKVEHRIKQLLMIEKKLYALRYCFEQEEYATAIYYAERQLKDDTLVLYHPHINRLIGRSLINLREYKDAQRFYEKLAETYDYAWVHVGLANSLLKQNMITEATELTDALLKREDTKFATYDLLAEYYIAREEFQLGYEIIQEATKLAPRNIERNKNSWNLARLNHDRLGQYVATKNMLKYAKNSIHDTPLLQLNVIRSAIDLAPTLTYDEANKLIARTERIVNELKSDFGAANELGEQLDIIEIRIMNSRKNKREAETALQRHFRQTLPVRAQKYFEDNLDKVKAYHEVGMWEQSMLLLEQMKEFMSQDSFTGKVLTAYIDQESRERKDIRYNPREIAEMASSYYKNQRYHPAYNLLCQATQLSPKNKSILISILKVLAIIAEEEGLTEAETEHAKGCIENLDGSVLTATQEEDFEEYKTRISKALTKAALGI